MCDIYENAHLTIAASSAPNCEAGCLSPRSRFLSKEVQFEFEGKMYMIKCRENAFKHDQLQWICKSVAHRESSPAEYRSYSDYVTFEKYKTINLKGKEDYYEWWRQIVVQDFNRRDLSFETDSLPALSGIAMQIIAKTQDDYLAGLWRHDLSLGLVWVRFRMSYLPSTYLAPSWSWPSVKGRGTVLETKRAGVRFHVIEAHCTPSGKNPAGEVSNGTITLSGLVTCRALNISALADGEDEKKMGYSLDLNDNLARAKREYFLKPKEQRAGWPFELDGFIETEYLPDVPLTGTLGISNLEN